MILKRRIIISFSFQLFKRLIEKEPDIINALIDMIIECGLLYIRQHIPRHACCRPIHKIIKLFDSAYRIIVNIIIYLMRFFDGLFHKRHKLRILIKEFFQGKRTFTVLLLRWGGTFGCSGLIIDIDIYVAGAKA